MADLIDRQALLVEMRRSGRAAYMIVQDAPTVDAVEVVRCKDCVHWAFFVEESCMGECHNMLKDDGIYKTMYDCDFCSEGERKDNE